PKGSFPFQSMGPDFKAICFECPIMSDFMNIGDQELIPVKIMINGYLLEFPVHTVAEITQFAATASGKKEMKRVLLPQIPTVLDRIRRDMLPEYLKNLNFYRQNQKELYCQKY